MRGGAALGVGRDGLKIEDCDGDGELMDLLSADCLRGRGAIRVRARCCLTDNDDDDDDDEDG